MSNQDIRLAREAAERDVQIVGLANSWIADSQQHYWNVRKAVPRTYDLFRGVLTGRFHVHKNNVHIPLLWSVIWSHAARKVQTLLGDHPPLRFTPASEIGDDAKIGRKMDNLIAAQFRDAKTFQKTTEFLVAADLYGNGIARHGWKTKHRNMPATHIDPNADPRDIVQVTDFNGPWWDNIDILDWFPQPGIKDVEDMAWAGNRYWLDFDLVREMAEEGIFNKAKLAQLKTTTMNNAAAMDSFKQSRGLSHFQVDDPTALSRTRAMRPIEIMEIWCRLPRELVTDGIQDRVISVGNGTTLLRNRPNPYAHGKKPFLIYTPNPDPHHHFAAGKGEIAGRLQAAINKHSNHALDVLDIATDPWIMFDRAANIDPRNLFLRPGRWIPVDGPPAERIMPGQVNLSGMGASLETSNVMWTHMQQATGIIEDTVLGGAGGSGTAREFLGRQEAVATRLLLEARLAEIQFLEPLGDMFLQNNRQFLPKGREFMILGDAAELDPVTGKPIPASRESISSEEMSRSYVAQAFGATSRLARSSKIQDLLLFTQAISASPQLMAGADNVSMVKMLGRELGLGAYANEILTRDPQTARAIGLQGAPGQAPPGQVNTGEGTPTQAGNLNNTLSQLQG